MVVLGKKYRYPLSLLPAHEFVKKLNLRSLYILICILEGDE